MDYNQYEMGIKELGWCALVGGVLAGVIAWLFYRSYWGMVLFPVITVFYGRQYKREQIKKRKEQLLAEFKDTMQAVSTALLAGYSMENAWREAEKEISELLGESSLMYAEVHQINGAVRMNEPLEKLLSDFAVRSGCEEIESFSEVFSFAKRSGGDFPKIIRTTVQKLTGRMEVEREIATVLAGKKLEGRIMNVMPIGILAYMTLTSGDFLDVLYGNMAGIFVMSTALLVYAVTLKLSEHILDIRV